MAGRRVAPIAWNINTLAVGHTMLLHDNGHMYQPRMHTAGLPRGANAFK
jgi:hypothetical protein